MELPGFLLDSAVTTTAYADVVTGTRLADGARVRVEVLRTTDPAVRDRLRAGESALRSADGRHLARVRQVVVDPALALVREDVRGEVLSAGAADPVAAVADVLDALAGLHAAGLVHGALTAGDVVLDTSVPLRRTVRLTGWGTAALVEPVPPVAAVDVRAAGRLLSDLLGPAVPPAVAPVLGQLLGDAPPSAAEARDALRRLLTPAPSGRRRRRQAAAEGALVSAVPVGPAQPVPPPTARPPRRALSLAALLLLAVALLAVGVLGGRRLAVDPEPLPARAGGPRPPPAGPYVFPLLQRDDGLVVERTWVLEDGGAALRGTTVVRNPTLEPRTASVEEVVPKSVAGDVADLDFTPEPDAVVERDPVVRFELRALAPGTSATWSFVVRLPERVDRARLVRLAADAEAARVERAQRTAAQSSATPLPGPTPTPTS